MLSSTLFLLIWSVSEMLSAPPTPAGTPTPLPASGPGVPSPDVGDPANALLILMVGLLVLAGIVVIAIGIRSARAYDRAEDEAQQRLMQAEGAPEPSAPDDDMAPRHNRLPASD